MRRPRFPGSLAAFCCEFVARHTSIADNGTSKIPVGKTDLTTMAHMLVTRDRATVDR
jgi:hypothetical protein